MASPTTEPRSTGCPVLHDATDPFPGVVAHHRPPGLEGLRFGHARAFHHATVERGEDASSYFERSGIAACAAQHGGLCSFRLGDLVALYQADNTPLAPDDALAPSLDLNRALFGDFMGSQPVGDPARHAKRRAVEASLGSARFVDALEPAIRRHDRELLDRLCGGPALPLDDFALQLVAHVDSFLPGVLDLSCRPLTAFLASPEYGRVARAYFELASEVISKVHPEAIAGVDAFAPFVRALLTDNYASIAAAADSNLIRRYFALGGRPFSRAAIAALTAEELKELGTVIVATYDTTQLSLLWTIAYVAADPARTRAVTAAARAPAPSSAALSPIDLVVLEAVRLGGSNPTALWRRVVAPFTITHRGRGLQVPAGVMLWLDRRRANRDPGVFPRPDAFDPDNVRAMVRSGGETVASLLSRNRYEINSFTMVNTHRNPRKCPGRLFSVREQAILMSELFGAYDVTVEGVDLALQPHSAMPRPIRPGTIRIAVLPTCPGDPA